MTRFRFVLALIACVGISVSIVFAQGEGAKGGTVRGKITEPLTQDFINGAQNPIEGVQVKIVGTDGTEYEATTDATGE